MANPTRSSNTESSTLGRGVAIQGRISGGGDLTVEGTIEGEVAIEGEFRIADDAEVRARVDASSAHIEGLFEGELNAGGIVHAGPQASVSGTIRAGAFTVDPGARIAVQIDSDFDLPPELGKSSR